MSIFRQFPLRISSFSAYLIAASRRRYSADVCGGVFGGVVRLSISVTAHYITEVGPEINVLHNLVDSIDAVGTITAFIGVVLQALFFFFGGFCFCDSIIFAVAP